VAFQKLVENNVYSLPCYEKDSKKYIGLLSLHAVVSRLLNLFGDKCGGLSHIQGHQFSPKDFTDIQYTFNSLDIDLEKDIVHVETMKPGISILDAINYFVHSKNDRSQVRLPIVEEDGTIANIVSPTMILKFLEQHLADLPENVTSRQVGKVPGVICKFFFFVLM
jgi:hypothetical protein